MFTEDMFECPKCHFEFLRPELPDGYTPGPFDKVVCANCGEVNLALVYEGFDPQDFPNAADYKNLPETELGSGLFGED